MVAYFADTNRRRDSVMSENVYFDQVYARAYNVIPDGAAAPPEEAGVTTVFDCTVFAKAFNMLGDAMPPAEDGVTTIFNVVFARAFNVR